MSVAPSIITILQQGLSTVARELTSQTVREPVFLLAPSHVAADLATNWPLGLFAQLSPEDRTRLELTSAFSLAEHVVIELQKNPEIGQLIETIACARPGFINITLTPRALQQGLPNFVDERLPLVVPLTQNEQILVEYADPNPFKEFHIGHLYNITVGETILRLLQGTGASAQAVCYQGDVGMHVAKSLWGMRHLFAEEGMDLAVLKEKALTDRIKFLGRAYAAGAKAYEDVSEAKLEMQEINRVTYLASQKRLEIEEGFSPKVDYVQGQTIDPKELEAVSELYTAGRSWSLQYFETMYKRLGTKFSEYFFESQSGEYGYSIVSDHIVDGVFAKSKGAVVFLGEKEGLHNRVFINSLGLPTYEAKDMGLPVLKQDRVGAYDRSIIITANEVDEYFKVVLKALSKVYPELAAKTVHLSHGVVRLPEGKMSSRTGNVLTGAWLLDEAKARILAIMAEAQATLPKDEQDLLADKLAVAAVKYALLKSNLGTNIAFSFDESLSLTGNSGPYLEYTYVRAYGILVKAAEQATNGYIAKLIDTLLNNKVHSDIELNSSERDVLLYLLSYSDTVRSAAQEYAPHQLCTYLFGLAQRFSKFYEACPILTKEAVPLTALQMRRLQIVAAVARILQEGMTLLGMPVVEKM